MDLFATLLLAHFLADFPLQTGKVYLWKTRSSRGLGVHVLIHGLVTALLIREPWRWWHIILVIITIHYLVDWTKLQMNTRPEWIGFILDQFAHTISLLPWAWLTPELETALPREWIPLDLTFALLLPVALLSWVVLKEHEPEDTSHPKFTRWVQDNMVRASQVFGMAVVIIVAVQRWFAA